MNPPAHLTFVKDEEPGFSRKRWGKGFIYFDEKNAKISEKAILDRIKKMVIPPMWENVWICPLENGYLQSTGKDLKKRKQYIYHEDWVRYRQLSKFSKLVSFGEHLSEIKKTYQSDLKIEGWPKNKVTALVVYLLDNHYLRIGNLHYSRKNETYGATTLRRKHLHFNSGELILEYTAKSGKDRRVKIDNPKIVKMIREISELPGYEIFNYYEGTTKYRLDSSDVNDYLREITTLDYTAKDFRTWHASKLAIEFYEDVRRAVKKNARLNFETQLVKSVAKALGNTISVCRTYYLHPTILGHLNAQYPKPLNFEEGSCPDDQLDQYEKYMMRILKSVSEHD